MTTRTGEFSLPALSDDSTLVDERPASSAAPPSAPVHLGDDPTPHAPAPDPAAPRARSSAATAPGAVTAPVPAAVSGARHARRTRRLTTLILLGLDAGALALAAVVAYLLRQSIPGLTHAGDLSVTVRAGAGIIAVGWLGAIALYGGYAARLVPSGAEILRNVMHASLAAAGIVGAVLYLSGIQLSRAFFVVLFVVGPPLLLLNRLLVRRGLNALHRRGHARQSVLVVGSLPHVDSIAGTIQRETWLGYDVVGAVIPHPDDLDDEDPVSTAGIPVLGREEDVLTIARGLRPGVLLFAAGASASAEEFRRTAWELEDLDVDLIVVPGLSEISGDRMSMRPVAGLPLVHLEPPRSRDAVKLSKRVFDVVASALILLAVSPVMAGIALAVKLGDGGPVIFRQQRVGRGGETFEFLKFRSMSVDAEARLAELQQAQRDRGNDVMFKMQRDPRITRVGHVLRRYSLDELPQLWNVLRGDMSLVGPRPALTTEVAGYDQDARRRLSVRPGITGLWQVSGRSDLSWSETVRLDLYYVDNWSFAQDALILAKTVRAVLAPTGAY